MDPHNRQLCWKLLQLQKKTCSILLTTHSMEEADALRLCDRVGILVNGSFRCHKP